MLVRMIETAIGPDLRCESGRCYNLPDKIAATFTASKAAEAGKLREREQIQNHKWNPRPEVE